MIAELCIYAILDEHLATDGGPYMKMGGIRFWMTRIHNMLGLVSALYVKTRN